MLLKATVARQLIFKVAFDDYKAKKGRLNMSELIAKAPIQYSAKRAKKKKSDFDQLSDEELQNRLDKCLDITDNNSYHEKIKAAYMSPTDKVNVSDIQSYVQDLLT